jgi:hypothetical protein
MGHPSQELLGTTVRQELICRSATAQVPQVEIDSREIDGRLDLVLSIVLSIEPLAETIYLIHQSGSLSDPRDVICHSPVKFSVFP